MSARFIATLRRAGAVWLYAAVSYAAADHPPSSPYDHVVAGIHFDSAVSGGPMPIVDLVKKASRADVRNDHGRGIQVVVLTDRDEAEIEYGVPLLRKLIRYRLTLPSIRTYGARRYLADIQAAQEQNPQLVVIPGAECLPFYYWEEDFSLSALWRAVEKRDIGQMLRLRKPHEHLLAIGLTEPKDYEEIPSLANGYLVVLSSAWLSLAAYAAAAGWGVWLLRRRTRRSRRRRARRAAAAWLLIVGGAVLCAARLIDPPRQYDAYHGDAGAGPYQAFIDYVNDRGGLVFWAHPEVEQRVSYSSPLGQIAAYTPSYADDLLWTRDYAGFAIFWEGMREIGKPGGVWDKVLKQYCEGQRKRPVWAIAELDYESDWAKNLVEETLTILLLKDRTPAVVRAFRAGAAKAGASAAAGSPRQAILSALRRGGLPAVMEDDVAEALRRARPRKVSESALLDALRKGAFSRYSRRGVLDALRRGKMYATRAFYASRLRVDCFCVQSRDGRRRAFSGDTISLSDDGELWIRLRALAACPALTVKVVRNGEVKETFAMAACKAGRAFDFHMTAPTPGYDGIRSRADYYVDFYRVLIYEGDLAVVATNPIFVEEATTRTDPGI